ncbi:MAG: hypothetical protein ACO2Z9_00460 [Crocinitomicaceae bacterium]
MKKLAVLLGAMAITGASFAQSTDTPMSLEGVLSFNGSSIQWSAPSLRFRYFVNENIAGRVQLGLGDGTGTPSSEMYTFYENGDGTGATGTQEISRGAWNAQIGGEYHMSATDRLSPYFMLGINFGGGSYSETWTESDGASYVQGLSAQVDSKMSMFGVGAGAGVDFYLVENLYAGLELGLSYNSITYDDVTTSVTVSGGGTSTTTTSVGGNAKQNFLGTGATTAAFRLGWRF